MGKARFSVRVNANGEKTKRCTKCKVYKPISTDFYVSTQGIYCRCKKCVIKENMAYQRRTKSWLYRYVDEEKQRTYQQEYYAKNKDKFKVYRKRFRERHPEYHKMYMRRKKEKQAE